VVGQAPNDQRGDEPRSDVECRVASIWSLCRTYEWKWRVQLESVQVMHESSVCMFIKRVVKTERLVRRHNDKRRVLIAGNVIYGPVVCLSTYDNF